MIDLPDRYEISKLLGEGGIGAVYLCKDLKLNRNVSIKVLKTESMTGSNMVRFQREAKALGRLEHPNVVKILDFGVSEGGSPYLVMDYLEGEDLDTILEREGSFDYDTSISYFSKIVRGLSLAHRKGIVHRDLKPGNIVYTKTGEIKMLDFGLARMVYDEDYLTAEGATLGSPLYMSPEQAKGEKIDYKSDVYSLGCLVFCMLTGKPPFLADTAFETIYMKLNNEVPRLNVKIDGAKVPQKFEELIDMMLKLDREERADLSHVVSVLNELNSDEGRAEGRIHDYGTKRSFNLNLSADQIVIVLFVLGLILIILGCIYYINYY